MDKLAFGREFVNFKMLSASVAPFETICVQIHSYLRNSKKNLRIVLVFVLCHIFVKNKIN